MSRAAAGIYIAKHLYDHHLADIEKVFVDAAVDHMAQGCEFRAGWRESVKAKLLEALPDVIGQFLEDEEIRCPTRGIGVKEAA